MKVPADFMSLTEAERRRIVHEGRVADGLPPMVNDPATLRRIAGVLRAHDLAVANERAAQRKASA